MMPVNSNTSVKMILYNMVFILIQSYISSLFFGAKILQFGTLHSALGLNKNNIMLNFSLEAFKLKCKKDILKSQKLKCKMRGATNNVFSVDSKSRPYSGLNSLAKP